MFLIVSGTNMPGTRLSKVSETIRSYYQEKSLPVELYDMANFKIEELHGLSYYKDKQPAWLSELNEKARSARGVVFVVPEYNGSYPGVLKLWLDHWSYPEAFKGHCISLIGLGGGQFGGLRPVDHLGDVFNYCESNVLPQRVYLRTVDSVVSKDGKIVDPFAEKLLLEQRDAFVAFCDRFQR